MGKRLRNIKYLFCKFFLGYVNGIICSCGHVHNTIVRHCDKCGKDLKRLDVVNSKE